MFVLDDRLQADTYHLGDLPLCSLLLMNDAQYPWVILVPKRAQVTEVFQLSAVEQEMLWRETARVSEAVKDCFGVEKINVAALGNVVKQLHMHVVGRRAGDAAWPGPVWGAKPAVPYDQSQIVEVRSKLVSVLGDTVKWCEA